MCGITGFINFRSDSSKQDIDKMVSAMSHRGPDGQGVFFVQKNHCQVAFGHRRLSVIDLSHAADQPMFHDGLTVIFNGEIYNYNEIKQELLAIGHQFETQSDTEVILHSWRQWGEDSIAKWRGMFAIALFDEKSNEIICIRDRAGVKPLNYYYREDLFVFGSEIKSLIAHPRFKKEINESSVASFLQYGYIPAPHSIFKNTYKLMPGFVLRLNLEAKKLTTNQYWNVYDFYNRPKLKISLPDAISETEKILKESFQYRMVADVPVGIFLSGGYDSSCVASLLQTDSSKRLNTFTIGMESDILNEAPHAKRISNLLGTDHTELYCSAKDAINIIPELPYYYDEPFADSSAIPTMLVSRLAKQKVTVALSADAGDEIFAGYNRYDYVARYGKIVGRLPKPLRKTFSKVMDIVPSDKIPILSSKASFYSRYDKVKNFLTNSAPADLLKNLSMVFTDTEVRSLVNGHWSPLETLHTSNELTAEHYDIFSFMMAVDYQTYLADDILQKVDRATMSSSLEGREPFLDQNIIEWAAQLPSNYKYNQGTKKYILKEIVHKYIPKSLMERPKSGFTIPIENWLNNELRDVVKEYLSNEAFQHHGIFNKSIAQQILTDFQNGRREKYLKVWYLLMFQMWYKKWMT